MLLAGKCDFLVIFAVENVIFMIPVFSHLTAEEFFEGAREFLTLSLRKETGPYSSLLLRINNEIHLWHTHINIRDQQ